MSSPIYNTWVWVWHNGNAELQQKHSGTYAWNNQVHRSNCFAIIVQFHVERLDFLGVVADEHLITQRWRGVRGRGWQQDTTNTQRTGFLKMTSARKRSCSDARSIPQ
jgi:hypothetical protein